MTNITKEKAEKIAHKICYRNSSSFIIKDSYILPNLNWVREDINLNQ